MSTQVTTARQTLPPILDHGGHQAPSDVTRPTVDLGALLGLELDRPLLTLTRRAPKGRVTMPGPHEVCIVASGAVVRRVRIGHRTASDLLGPGDVLASEPTTHAPFETSAHALTRSSFAIVDRRLSARSTVLALALIRSLGSGPTRLTYQHAVAQLVSIEERAEWLLPLLADRWGVMTRDGVVLPAFLTHTVMADLLGARRPSFTSAAARLEAAGTLTRLKDGRWRLGASAG